jgi:signal transduction histidine kinase
MAGLNAGTRGVTVLVTDGGGGFAGFIGSCIDVDERRRAQEAEQQYHQEPLTLGRDFERWILAIVSHDIRNPLANIKLATEVLQRLDEPASEVGKQAKVVARGVDRIHHIVGDLLDLSRLREGLGIPVQRTSVDMRALCQQIIDELKATARDRRIDFECAADGHGAWDEHRLLQAISNLTSNAVQHSVPGSPVHVRLTGDEQNVAVEVHNEGVIPHQLLPRIFEPFRSGRHYTKRGDGLGLGLFIARAIASAHGGSLEVDSSHGVTKFQLLLPRRIPSAAAVC